MSNYIIVRSPEGESVEIEFVASGEDLAATMWQPAEGMDIEILSEIPAWTTEAALIRIIMEAHEEDVNDMFDEPDDYCLADYY